MQPRFPIVILVLKSERLVRIRVNPFVPVQTAPGAIFAVPQQIAVHIGHLARNADLVGVDVGEILLFVFGVVEDLRQRLVGILVGVDMGVAALAGVFLRQPAAVPDETGPLRFGRGPGQFVFALFGEAAPERVVGVFPDFGIAGFLFNLGADELVFGVVLEILVFAVGQLAVNQVAQSVVGVFGAVVFFQPVAGVQVGVGRGFQTARLGCGRLVGRQDVARRVEGEFLAVARLAVPGFLNPAEFVVNVVQYAAAVVGAPDQVARFVVGVEAV